MGGGMGGMPAGMFSEMFAGGVPGGMGGMPGGGFGGHPGMRRPRKPQPFQHSFPCSLEDYYRGATKKCKITRQVRGQQVQEVLEFPVKAGWKKGTKLTFEGKGHEIDAGLPGDVVLVLDEKPHPTFKREGNDLVVQQRVPLKQALCGFATTLTHLDGRQLRVEVKEVVSDGFVKVVKGEGMPISKTNGAQKGDLKLRFRVDFPRELTDDQKAELKRIL
mmetsp:Transcript_2396/g.6680  ORF Transcript_2396/g.6680 Transcript_2396/m.6680 type:complete len:218 (+) Transcript_2396:3-656(+)